jgi:hypothetical protein
MNVVDGTQNEAYDKDEADFDLAGAAASGYNDFTKYIEEYNSSPENASNPIVVLYAAEYIPERQGVINVLPSSIPFVNLAEAGKQLGFAPKVMYWTYMQNIGINTQTGDIIVPLFDRNVRGQGGMIKL